MISQDKICSRWINLGNQDNYSGQHAPKLRGSETTSKQGSLLLPMPICSKSYMLINSRLVNLIHYIIHYTTLTGTWLLNNIHWYGLIIYTIFQQWCEDRPNNGTTGLHEPHNFKQGVCCSVWKYPTAHLNIYSQSIVFKFHIQFFYE